MNWKSVDQLPPEGKLVLLVFEKKNPTRWGETGTFIVEGYFKVSEACTPMQASGARARQRHLHAEGTGAQARQRVTHWTESYELP